jgi:uncharacterized protein involved in tolerance to divalent cations
MGAIVVVTTVGDEQEALTIGREMVARRHAACVNVMPGVRSVYRWKGKICRDGEYMLLIPAANATSTASRARTAVSPLPCSLVRPTARTAGARTALEAPEKSV